MENLDYLRTGINETSFLMRFVLQREFAKNQLFITPVQFLILILVIQNEGISQNEIAQQSIKDKTTITRHLNQLEKKKLILRKKSDEDKRISKIFITKEGKKVAEKSLKISKKLRKIAMSDIDEESLKITKKVLKQINKNLSICL